MNEIGFDARCSECGGRLEVDVVYGGRWSVQITVNPCERCMDEANKEGFELGLKEERDERDS